MRQYVDVFIKDVSDGTSQRNRILSLKKKNVPKMTTKQMTNVIMKIKRLYYSFHTSNTSGCRTDSKRISVPPTLYSRHFR